MKKVLALVTLAAGAYVLILRPLILRWGATCDEVRDAFPGDIICLTP